MKKKQYSLTKDPINELFINIAIPSCIGTMFQTFYNLVDTFFAGKISPEALAAIAQTFPVYFIIIALGIGIGIGSTALISNSIGDKNKKKASLYLAQTLLISLIVAIITTIIGLLFGPVILKLMGTNTTTLNLSIEYIQIIFLGSIFFFIQIAANSALTAIGNTKSYRNVMIFSFWLNIILNHIESYAVPLPIPKIVNFIQ